LQFRVGKKSSNRWGRRRGQYHCRVLLDGDVCPWRLMRLVPGTGWRLPCGPEHSRSTRHEGYRKTSWPQVQRPGVQTRLWTQSTVLLPCVPRNHWLPAPSSVGERSPSDHGPQLVAKVPKLQGNLESVGRYKACPARLRPLEAARSRRNQIPLRVASTRGYDASYPAIS